MTAGLSASEKTALGEFLALHLGRSLGGNSPRRSSDSTSMLIKGNFGGPTFTLNGLACSGA
jgi:hypothetical protein